MAIRSDTWLAWLARATAIVVLGLLGIVVLGAAPASAEVPPYKGMSFPQIQGPADPEEFSWKVTLDDDQELKLIDDQHAVVYYKESGDPPHVAFQIDAGPAHDSSGATVPTTIALSEGNVITLTVHHRAGNPAAGGSQFDYPVTEGVGWEGGFHTYEVIIPGDHGPALPHAQCVVPRLTGKSLKATRLKLKNAGCKLGKVRGSRSKAARVVKQGQEPGTVLRDGPHVAVRLDG